MGQDNKPQVDLNGLGKEYAQNGEFDFKWQNCVVGMQHVRSDAGVFWNLGEFDGNDWVLRITEEGLELLTKQECYDEFNILWFSNSNGLSRRLAGDDAYGGINDISLLWQYVLCENEHKGKVIGWLVNTMICGDTQMVLELIGRSGCGKSTAGDFIRDMLEPIDPDTTSGRARKSLTGLAKVDKYRAIQKNALIYEDNVAGLKSDMQVLLCQICTGIMIDVRLMYSSSFEKLWLKRPVILTGTNDLITRPDLVSRSLRVRFTSEPGKDKGFTKKRLLKERWALDKPRILRALAELVSKVMQGMGDSGGRMDIYDHTMMVIHGRIRGAELIKGEKFSQIYETIQASPFCFTWIAFVQQHFGQEGLSISQKTTREWLDLLEDWWGDNVGKRATIELTDGGAMTAIVPTNEKHYRAERTIPTNPRGLGALLNKYANEIYKLAGIESDKIKGKHKLREVSYVPFI